MKLNLVLPLLIKEQQDANVIYTNGDGMIKLLYQILMEQLPSM